MAMHQTSTLPAAGGAGTGATHAKKSLLSGGIGGARRGTGPGVTSISCTKKRLQPGGNRKPKPRKSTLERNATQTELSTNDTQS